MSAKAQSSDTLKAINDSQSRANETNEFFHEDTQKNVSRNDSDDPSIF